MCSSSAPPPSCRCTLPGNPWTAQLASSLPRWLHPAITDSLPFWLRVPCSATQLRSLAIEFWGSGNALPRELAAATGLTSLRLQCSSPLARSEGLGRLRLLQELEVVDSDWARIPLEVAGEGCQ